MKRTLFAALAALLLCLGLAQAREQAVYVGSAKCSECHPDEYENFSRFAKKAHSWESIQIMASDLTQEEIRGCYACHTTGYGKPGGFVSVESTPNLRDAGCEVCHGPGSLHVDAGGDASLIKSQLELSDCEGCHNKDRVAAFNFKPLLHGGAH